MSHRWGRHVGWAVFTAAMVFVASRLGAQPAPTENERRRIRRTPAVEIFQKWSESVVFVTGPVVPAGGPTLDAFFDLPQGAKLEKSVGTGLIVHESGYVLTNAHGAERIITHEVVLADGFTHPAELIWTVTEADLALLKIEADHPLPLRAVEFAPAGDLMIGETVVVIGNPQGLRHTCTTGVVSAVGRETKLLDFGGVTLRDMVQTDAGINPGSSGGPWFNVLGEVIGLTASMKSDSQNIAFAVSSATVRKWLPEMLDVHRRYGFTPGIRLAAGDSCRISAVEPGTPAARAGIHEGDLLIELAGKPIRTGLDFHLALVGRQAGQTIRAKLQRADQTLRVEWTPNARPKPDARTLLGQKLGVSAAPLDEATATRLSLRVPRGVVITGVVAPELYEKLNHRPAPGDVLAKICKIRPRDIEHVGGILDRVEPDQPITMKLLRHGSGDTVTLVSIRLAPRAP